MPSADPSKRQKLNINLNLNVRGLSNSATLYINERSKELEAQGKTVYKLGLGQSPFPVPDEVQEALRQNAHQKDYLAVQGLPALREAVAEYNTRGQKIKCTADDVMIGPGSKELIFLLQLVYYGDLVIPTPSWVSYSPQARIIGRHVHWVKTHPQNAWRLVPDELERLCEIDPERPRIVILNYPANPTGATYSTERLRKLAEVARKYKVILISDEIYGELHFKGQHVSIARFYPEGTIVSGGLSKWCGAGGWRLGTFTFPKELHWLLIPMASVASETYTATSAPIQYAAIRAYQGSEAIETYLQNSRRVLKALGRRISDILNDAGITHPRPDGAFYLFGDFSSHMEALKQRGIETSSDLCNRLLDETGVATLPGSNFGRPDDELTVRMAYVDFDGEQVLKVVSRIPADQALDDDFLLKNCPKVMQAVNRICNWVNNGQ